MIAVFAIGPNREFGYKDGLPWGECLWDKGFFQCLTWGREILVGSRTKLPRELRGRQVIRIGKDQDLSCITEDEGDTDLICIGGATTLIKCEPFITHCVVTRIPAHFIQDCDLWLPKGFFVNFTKVFNPMVHRQIGVELYERLGY